MRYQKVRVVPPAETTKPRKSRKAAGRWARKVLAGSLKPNEACGELRILAREGYKGKKTPQTASLSDEDYAGLIGLAKRTYKGDGEDVLHAAIWNALEPAKKSKLVKPERRRFDPAKGSLKNYVRGCLASGYGVHRRQSGYKKRTVRVASKHSDITCRDASGTIIKIIKPEAVEVTVWESFTAGDAEYPKGDEEEPRNRIDDYADPKWDFSLEIE